MVTRLAPNPAPSPTTGTISSRHDRPAAGRRRIAAARSFRLGLAPPAAMARVVAAGVPARLRTARTVRVADAVVRDRQLLGLRPDGDLPRLRSRQLPGPAHDARDNPRLPELAGLRCHRLGNHAV